MMVRLLLLVLALLLGLPTTLRADDYSSLWIFGDSLSDTGNAYSVTEGVWPVSPPYAQRFSDGPVAAEVLASELGLALTPSTEGGTNFAFGGATTGIVNFNFEVNSPLGLPAVLATTGMLAQVDGFVSSGATFTPGQSLFMLWGGANDFFLGLATGADLVHVLTSAVNNLATAVTQLALIGASDFLVPNLPNLANTPFGLSLDPGDRLALNDLSLAFNAALARALESVREVFTPLNPAFRLIEFDVASFFDEVLMDPSLYGFANVTDPCFAFELADCEGFFFVDGVHPTSAAHALLGAAFARAVVVQVPEPGSLALTILALLLLTSMRRHARQG